MEPMSDSSTPVNGKPIQFVPMEVDAILDLEVEGALYQLFDAVVDTMDDALRLRVLNYVLDGRVRRSLEGERQKLDPWGSWMHSSLLDTAKPGEHETAETRKHVDTWQEGNVLYSLRTPPTDANPETEHVLALDIDLPMRVVPSTHPGRGHLWINKLMPWDDVLKVLAVLVEVGVVSESYRQHSVSRGYTCLRPAFVDKKPWSTDSDDVVDDDDL